MGASVGVGSTVNAGVFVGVVSDGGVIVATGVSAGPDFVVVVAGSSDVLSASSVDTMGALSSIAIEEAEISSFVDDGSDNSEYTRKINDNADKTETIMVCFFCFSGSLFNFFLKNINHTRPAIHPKTRRKLMRQRIPIPLRQVNKHPPPVPVFVFLLTFLFPPILVEYDNPVP